MENKRACGGCTECCKTHPIEALKKEAGKPCLFRVKGKGCQIYKNRPLSCAEFECQWLKGHGEESDRPDKTGVVIDFISSELIGNVVMLWEALNGALESEYGRALVARFADMAFPVAQRYQSGKEVLFVPHTLAIPTEILEALTEDRRRVFLVETRPQDP